MTDQKVQRPDVYLDSDGTIVYRAYNLGGCITGLTAARLGESAYPANASLRAHMDASSAGESLIIDAYCRERGHTVIWQQKEVELVIQESPRIVVRGHIDGLDQEDDDVIEVKFLGPSNWEKYNNGGLDGLGMLGLKYKWQGAIYGWSLTRPVRYVIAEKVTDKTTGEVTVGDLIIEPPVWPGDLVLRADIEDRALTVEEAAEIDEFPPCDRNCREGDAFSHVHMFDTPTVHGEDLFNLLQRDEQLALQITSLQADREELRDAIKEQYGVGKHTAGPYTASIVEVRPTKFDKRGLKRDHPEIVEAYTVPGQPYVRLSVDGTSLLADEEATG